MDLPVEANFTFILGDTVEIPLTFLDPNDNSILDVTGFHLYITVKRSKYEPDEDAVVSKTLTFGAEGADGKYTIVLNRTDTENLIPMRYDYDIQIATPDKQDVVTLVEGKMKMKQGSTQRV